LVCWGVFF